MIHMLVGVSRAGGLHMIFESKITEKCQWTVLRLYRLTLGRSNINSIETDNSKLVERRGRKAMDLNYVFFRNKVARLPKLIPQTTLVLTLQSAWPKVRPGTFVNNV